MKNLFTYTALLFSLLTLGTSYGQITCDSITAVTSSYLNTSKDQAMNRIFISDGQVYRAFLRDDEASEFQSTFYGGSTYRIATSAGIKDNYIIFEVFDTERNLLFSNEDYEYAPYWDFSVENSLNVTIEVKLDVDKKVSGCASVMIGFAKQN
jgi:hypothetical protein